MLSISEKKNFSHVILWNDFVEGSKNAPNLAKLREPVTKFKMLEPQLKQGLQDLEATVSRLEVSYIEYRGRWYDGCYVGVL